MQIDLRLPEIMNPEARGNLLGYTTMGLSLSRALAQRGCELTEAATVALHIAPPHLFRPMAGKTNWLLTMWESRDVPPKDVRVIAEADGLIVPSWFCYHTFRRAMRTMPIRVVPLGIWSNEWPYHERVHHGAEPLRFLWVSARSIRKGWQQLWQAWCEEFTPRDRVALTIKTTIEREDGAPLWMRWHGVTFDRRYLLRAALQALYRESHVFIHPNMGEGFNLPVLEAMASGMLVIAPFTTGQRDFVNKSVAWQLETKYRPAHYGVDTDIPVPTIQSIRHQMRAAVAHFTETKALRERGSAQAHQYTWERTAQGVMRVVEQVA